MSERIPRRFPVVGVGSDWSQVTDESLVQRACANDNAALGALLTRYEGMVHKVVYLFLRPGDTVHVEGDGLSGPTGPVLLNASVERRSGVAVLADNTPAPSARGIGSPPRSHRGQKRRLSPSKGLGAQSAGAEGNVQEPSEDRSSSGSFFFGNANVSARKKRPEGIWLKLRHMTTGTDRVGDDPRWQRSEETSGP